MGLLALVALAWAVAAALRALRVAGHAVVGGLVAGAVLGPTLLGRVAPNLFEDAFLGGRTEREAWRSIERERIAWELAVATTATGSDEASAQRDALPSDAPSRHAPSAGDGADRANDTDHTAGARGADRTEGAHGADVAERADLADRAARERLANSVAAAWRAAAHEAQRPLRVAATLLAALVLLGIAGAGRGRHSAGAISIGLWSAGLPAALGLVLLWWRGESLDDSAALWLLAALAVGPWWLDPIDRAAAEGAEHDGAALLVGAGLVASTIAAALALAALVQSMALLPALVVLATPLGLAARVVRRGTSVSGVPPRWLSELVDGWGIPALAALAAVRIEFIVDASWSALLVVPLLAGDARWLGAFIGAMLPGERRPQSAMRLVLPSTGCAPTTIAYTAAALWSDLLARDLALGLLLGAAIAAATLPLRRRVDESLRQG